MVLERSKDQSGQWIKEPAEYLTSDLVSYGEYKRNRSKPYIAAFIKRAEFQEYAGEFVIGKGEKFSTRLRRSVNKEYKNGPLFEKTKYSVFQRAYINEVCLNFRFQSQYNE